jgi:hypothetical protein
MKTSTGRLAGLVLAAALPVAGANAQLESMLGKGGHGGDLKGLAGMAGAPLASGSMGNVAGLLQYCIGNNYLSGGAASAIKDQLVGKLPGGSKTQDPGYADGVKGLLHGNTGRVVDLNGGGAAVSGGSAGSVGSGGSAGVTADLTKKACDTVLAQAKSFL